MGHRVHLTSLQPYTLHPYVFEMNRGRGQRNSIYNINIIYTISLKSFYPTFALLQNMKTQECKV